MARRNTEYHKKSQEVGINGGGLENCLKINNWGWME